MKILIDIAPMIPGKGGAGGGIWVYTRSLLLELDALAWPEGWEIYCLKHKDNTALPVSRIRILETTADTDGILNRLKWVHLTLPAICRKHGIDVLHRVIPELPLFGKTKTVCTLHDFMFRHYLEDPELRKYLSFAEKVKFRIFSLITAHACARAHRIIVPTQAVAMEAERRFPELQNKVAVTHEAAAAIGISGNRDRPGGEAVHLISVAGFYPHKGQRHLIQMAALLKKKARFPFVITLRGNPAYPAYEAALHREIDALGLNDSFRFPAFTKAHAIADIYTGQHIFLLLSSYEGFGLPLLEAQQYGLPVICSDIPVFREVLGSSACFVNPGDPETAVQAILKLVEDKQEQENLCKAGTKNLLRFSWEKMAQETVGVYQSMINTLK